MRGAGRGIERERKRGREGDRVRDGKMGQFWGKQYKEARERKGTRDREREKE